METKDIKIKMVEDDAFDVIINNELEVHIRCNDTGYSVDLYKHTPQDEMGDDYDFDDDYISSCTAWFDDLHDEDPYNFKLVVGIHEDNDPDYLREDFDYEVRGGDLRYNDVVILQHAADDIPALINAIKESISVVDEVAYIKDKDDNYLYKKVGD